MSLTVETCMNLPAFRYAKIVAGKGGVNQSVNSITVLEYSDVDVISSDLFLNHEMCITAFSSIKDDVNAQCAIVRRMKEIGVCAIVLYYVGIFVPYLDERLIKTADDVNLPLICMPFNRFDFRYGEAINDVMYAIYRDQQENINFIPDVLENISELPERLRTIRSLLQIISDRFHCSFVLFNQKGELISEGQWPWSAGWNYSELVQYFLDFPDKAMSMSQTKMHIDKKDVFVTYSIVTPEHKTQLHLFVIDEQKSITHEQTSQAAELIALFMSISNFSLEETFPEMIIRSIIKNEQMQIRELSAKHGIDTTKIQRMWILSGSDGLGAYKQKRLLKQDVTEIRKFFRNRDRWALVDLYQNAIVVLFQAAAFSEFDERLEAEIMEVLSNESHHLDLVKCMNITSLQNIQDTFELYEAYLGTARLIYPTRNIFDLYDLHFAEKLKKLTDDGGHKIAKYIYFLQPIRQEPNYNILLETLAAYLLDADKNLQRTAAILGVHKNTVRYRMNQIRACYACDIAQNPLGAELYEAVALQRLLVND